MKQTPYLFLASLSMLAGCASTSTQMVNDKGQVANCGAWGFGIIGAPVALIQTQDCINKYQAAGYKEAGSPQTVGSQQAVMQDAPTSSTTIPSKDGLFKFTLPAGWTQAPPPSVAYELYAKNSAIDSGLLMSSVGSKDIQDWQVYAESLRAKLANSLTQSTSSEVQRIKVNGFDALRADIGGVAKNGVKLHYLGTVIKTDQKLIWLVTWCLESRFVANRNEFEKLPAGLQL